MSHTDVTRYLAHERENLLKYGVEKARELRDQTVPSPGGPVPKYEENEFEWKLYDAWVEYFEELVLQSNAMVEMSSDELVESLNHEYSSLRKLERILKEIEPFLEDEPKFLVSKLRELLKIERKSTKRMCEECEE